MTNMPQMYWIRAPKGISGLGMGPVLMLALLLAGAWIASEMVQNHALYALLIGAPLLVALFHARVRLRRAETRLKTLAELDRITALPNRPTFVRRTQQALPQAGALLLVDMDDFTGINHRKGRDTGDLCLMVIAQRLRELTRLSDVVGRLDGASFAVYLPGATLEQAHDISQRLCEGAMILTPDGELRLTTSIGAVLADGCTPLDKLLQDAELALGRAKLQGRARVVLEDLPMVA